MLPLLPRRTRYSPAAMIAFYDKILRQIEKEQGDVTQESEAKQITEDEFSCSGLCQAQNVAKNPRSSMEWASENRAATISLISLRSCECLNTCYVST